MGSRTQDDGSARESDFVSVESRRMEHIQRSDAYRLLLIDGTPVRFTQMEYRLVLLLIEQPGAAVTLAALTQVAFGLDPTRVAREALVKHIERIRSKLRPVGVTVAHVHNFGYVLLPTDD